jgi:hypothetical protein
MSIALALIVMLAVVTIPIGVVLLILRRTRSVGKMLAAGGFVYVVSFSMAGALTHGTRNNEAARAAGWASWSEQQNATAAGITDPATWREKVAVEAKAEAEARAAAEQAKAEASRREAEAKAAAAQKESEARATAERERTEVARLAAAEKASAAQREAEAKAAADRQRADEPQRIAQSKPAGVMISTGRQDPQVGSISNRLGSLFRSQPQSPIEVRISAASDGKPMPVIEGETNLPDGAELLVSVQKVTSRFMAQGKAPVTSGKFRAGPFSSGGGPLSPGDYEVSISMSVARFQPEAVQLIIGDRGQNLTGENVKESAIGDLGNSVSYEFSLTVPGDPEAGLPKGWREITTDFCTALQASGSCKTIRVRSDTEGKLETKFGYKVRGTPGTDVASICLKAMFEFKGDAANCAKAWEDYGCKGRRHARLLQESPFVKSSALFCEY